MHDPSGHVGRAGSAGGQCRWCHGDARPPHEQGAGALCCVSDGAAVGADGGRLGSRSLPPAKACVGRRCLAPQGQGALPVCGIDAVCPVGAKALQSGAPDFGLSRERAGSWGALPIRNGWQARRGTGKGPRRFTIFRTRKSQRSAPSARPVFPTIPQGERRALPAPAQGIHPLRIPFWGNRRFLRRPRPPKRRRRQAPARGPAAVYSLYRPLRNETQQPRPIRDGAGMRRLRAKGAVSRHCRRRRRPAARAGPRPLRSRPRPRR